MRVLATLVIFPKEKWCKSNNYGSSDISSDTAIMKGVKS